jgi:glycosyltransferase involved in cell wall biosynthesis
MPRLRIAMLTTFFPPYNFGGDGIGVQRLATALADRGCEVTVVHDENAYVSLAGGEPAAVPATDERIRVIGLRSRLGAGASLLVHQLGRPVVHASRLAQILRPGAFDVVWYHNVSLIGGPGLLACGDGLKLYEAHEHWLVCPTHVLWRYNREPCDERHCLRCVLSYRRPPQLWRYTGALERALDHVDAFIAKSEFSRDMHRSFGFARPMRVIPYFLPDESPAARGDAATETRAPYFLFVGRLEKIKGLQDVIPAFAGRDGPRLVIVGSGDYEAALRRQAADMPRVEFAGKMAPSALSGYYEGALALIAPSVCYETFGIILIEAFRKAIPVVARRIGPFPEILEGGGGMLFSSPDELRAALDRLAGDGAYRDRLAREARASFEARWREDVVVDEYLSLLRDTARAKRDARVLSALEASW